jgi:hypothetical protein
MAERAWLMLAYGDARKYGGNEGYSDSADFYSFDSRVANWRQVTVGDLALIAGRRKRAGPPELNGVARVEGITTSDDVKVVRKCPVCGHPRFSARVTMSPKWRCDHGHEFDDPAEDVVAITKVVASFGDSYRPAAGAMTAAELKQAQLHPHNTNAIRPLDPELVRRLFSWDPRFEPVVDAGGFANPEDAAMVDTAALPIALELIRARWSDADVEPQSHGNPGFDFLVARAGSAVRFVELKATRKTEPGFFMSGYQRRFSEDNADRYSLLVLTGLDPAAGTCSSSFHDGFVEDHFALSPIEYRAGPRQPSPPAVRGR